MNTATTDTTQALVEYPQAAKAARQADAVYELAEAYVIDSAPMYEAAGAELVTITTKLRELEETRLGITRPMDAAKAKVMELFKAPAQRLEAASALLRQGMLTYKRAEDEKARLLAEEAERAQLAERQRLERERVEAEDLARKLADEAAATDDAAERERLQQEADDAQMAALDAAEAVEVAEVAPPVRTEVVTIPRAAGVSSRETWKADVTDLAALVTYVAEQLAKGNAMPLGYLEANTSALGGLAKSLKANAKVPGVRFYAEAGLAVRRR